MINLVVGIKNNEFVVTRFDEKIREFGLTSDEVDQYISYLRTAQKQLNIEEDSRP